METCLISPYIYRYTLGKDRERTQEGKYVVYHNGEKKEIETTIVEFFAPYDEWGNPKILTIEEFKEIIKGTKGVTAIQGEFKYV